MFALIAAALAAATPAPLLDASSPWWERITVTVDDKGAEHGCRYESSISGQAEACDDQATARSASRPKQGAAVYSKLTFERRFSPGAKVDSGRLEVGDKLLARQVLFLTIGGDGTVESCRVVATSGDLPPNYDCEEARGERFQAAASGLSDGTRQAFMTVLVYGHVEQIA